MTKNTCDVCEKPWVVLFEWSYTSPERYCREHILEPVEGQPGQTLLDYMPDCQRITHRIMPVEHPEHRVRLRSTDMLYPVLLSRLPPSVPRFVKRDTAMGRFLHTEPQP